MALPTVRELVNDVKSLTRLNNGDFQSAWEDSFDDGYHCHEEGGFIYIDFPIKRPITRAYVQRAPKGGTMNQRTKGDNASIDLNNPGISRDNVILVANFHTHPLSTNVQGDPQPSKADKDNAYHRGLPGIVISRDGIYAYGPEERNGTSNPRGYAPSVPIEGAPKATLVKAHPPPEPVPNQWPERAKFEDDIEMEEDGQEEEEECSNN
ncbi:hypothetical protein JR316_0013447 [Psilocybe cubensis]|uniref:Uncharacterized protein n=2 Tax=Psilocybe cubensis TaxID=181762 RepID=A0A8H7XKW5_PSICU|nr:uncharacterized protein JR316_0013447 [Psilocybe cubensis]KAH9474284.1 hypothetical protein JR316_0013447 [Psilocybe cubensis]